MSELFVSYYEERGSFGMYIGSVTNKDPGCVFSSEPIYSNSQDAMVAGATLVNSLKIGKVTIFSHAATIKFY